MLSRVNNGMVWMDGKEDENSASWTRNNNNMMMINNSVIENEEEMGPLSTFKSMLEVDDDNWYVSGHNQQDITFSQPNLSDPSCSQNTSVFNNLDASQAQYFMPPKNTISSFLNVVSNNPLEQAFDLSGIGFLNTQQNHSLNRTTDAILNNFTDLTSNNQITASPPNLCSNPQFGTTTTTPLLQFPENGTNFTGFRGVYENNSGNNSNSLLLNRSKLLRPLETFPSTGAQPTLFQKRAALRKNNSVSFGPQNSPILIEVDDGYKGKKQINEDIEKYRRMSASDDLEDVSIDNSGLNYDSDEFLENSRLEEICKNSGSSSNANTSVNGGVDQKGKKKAMPAKNLMAERRRRKKLNDRLYMLRSVVPKISKMDRASILGDAIEYLKELLQRINDLHTELESVPPGTALATTSSFHPLTPTPPSLHSRIKDELVPSALASPTSQARVEVKVREGRAVNIHMFCGRRPGLLLSTMKALDSMGLDIQQAVISCFNGFAMDIFRAEQCKEGQDVHPEHIKAVLLDSAGFQGMM
ncbi:hypothetical protein LWI29_021316 [Acer saccharum]|uniref:BHLH domain-containing protein n=1 Tax=Acer saccharum TaxID=4024 RepID=A0AA39SBQ9_ACESA|nr:hypothetical protein LWI29_021316 [Acer saccharum]KAK1569018.1 hypothetical protein Q3G72_031746 [Acer saccharum]